MRKLMWFTLGFAAACLAGVGLHLQNWCLLLGLPFLAVALITLGMGTQKAKIVRFLCLGCVMAFLWVWLYDTLYLQSARVLDGESLETVVEITDYSEQGDYSVSAEGKLRIDRKSYQIRIFIYEPLDLSPGDRVTGNFRMIFTASNDEKNTYHQGAGTFLLGVAEDDLSVERPDTIPVKYHPAVMKRQIIQLIHRLFPSDTIAFAQALFLGDTSLLNYETDTALSVSGIRHVVAVSGLHVSVLFSLVLGIFGYRRFVTPIFGGALLVLFAAITGFSPSVVRACIMHGLMLLGLMFQKEYDPPTALSFAVLTMLAANPLAITGVALQLSVSCVAGILLFSGSIQKFLMKPGLLGKAKPRTVSGRIKRWFAGSVSITLSTLITTTPLCAAYFGTISIIGCLTNLVTLWVVTVIFYGIVIACVLGAFWFPAGQLVAYILAWPIRFVLSVARIFAKFPLAAVYTQSPYVVAWIILCYSLLAVFLICRKYPWVMGGCMLFGLAFAIALSWVEPKLNNYRMTVLDVGQGQCVLLQYEDQHYVVDCGGDSPKYAADVAARMLLSQGITHLDGVIVSHYDKDHAGGIPLLLTRIPTDRLYLPDITDTGELRSELMENFSAQVILMKENTETRIPEAALCLFCGNNKKKSDNESSTCVLFQPENCDILITGDRGAVGERALIEQTELPDVEILVAGHHGAADAANIPLLHTVRPEVVIISVGEDNHYGHPSQETLERLALYGCQILRTDLDGTVIIRG